jgi:hypothetical protein
MMQTKLQLSLGPFVEEKQNVLSAIGKIQILAVNFFSYVSLNLGLSEVDKYGMYNKMHRDWYSLAENAVVSISALQLGWCVYFMAESIFTKQEKQEKLEEEIEEAEQYEVDENEEEAEEELDEDELEMLR